MPGYWDDEDANAAAIDADGWMHTDLAVMDDDGYLRIVGRIKDTIIRGGENISPRDIEEVPYGLPEVGAAEVIGVPGARYGEEVMAWVKLRDGARATAEDLVAASRGRIAGFKIPPLEDRRRVPDDAHRQGPEIPHAPDRDRRAGARAPGAGGARLTSKQDAVEASAEPLGQRWSTGRIEAFSDGVFAIAITLLVLEIRVPASGFEHLAHSLAQQWPAYLSYVTSFLTVGAVWLAHHNLFTRLRFIDPMLMRINIMLLMVAAFLPFPTSVLAEALHASRTAERTAVVFYGATAIAIELLLETAQRYAAAQPDLMHAGRAPAVPEQRQARGRGGPSTVLYVVAGVVGVLLLPKAAALGYLLVAVRSIFVAGGESRLLPRWLRAG